MFELHKLGWSGFQQLCLSIIREISGQTAESFLDTLKKLDHAETGTSFPHLIKHKKEF